MQIRVRFHSYFRELAGCSEHIAVVADDATLSALHEDLALRFPKLGAMKNSTLLAVGVDYQPRDYVLKEGDEVSLFPPVQGG